ncbi:MAG TPA: endonuclease/exonuclease/phosphatase family protein [Bacteroidales bacterium]|nr:endonuclease/exonuclease/phosphatase family protein [Bacteroidales bacterium]
MERVIYILLFLMMTPAEVGAQEFTVMFYNTENLFDTVDDSLTDDSEFLPGGERRWTYDRYWKKIDALSRVIASAGGWETPFLVGLCEVENRNVVGDLSNRSLLANAGYGVIHHDSPDSRGIDPALMYRSQHVRVIESRGWIPPMAPGEVFNSRNLLYIKTLIYGDTLHLILCHWPSRRGGVLAAERLREAVASLVISKVDSIQAAAGGMASVIVTGDFNSTPSEPVMVRLADESGMANLSAAMAKNEKGSYRYRGLWEMIDQVLVSDIMTTGEAEFNALSQDFSVFDAPFLLEDDPDYPGKRPLATYRAYKWEGGYSDHLPVLVRIRHR